MKSICAFFLPYSKSSSNNFYESFWWCVETQTSDDWKKSEYFCGIENEINRRDTLNLCVTVVRWSHVVVPIADEKRTLKHLSKLHSRCRALLVGVDAPPLTVNYAVVNCKLCGLFTIPERTVHFHDTWSPHEYSCTADFGLLTLLSWLSFDRKFYVYTPIAKNPKKISFCPPLTNMHPCRVCLHGSVHSILQAARQ